jgi:L-methionine (R)-S-oxide reductase
VIERTAKRAPEAGESNKRRTYQEVRSRLDHLLEGEDDWIATLATIACELHLAFAHFEWTGFYRVIRPGLLAVGPYQGPHGCLRIPFARGICGAAARTGRTQRVDDVSRVADHIACSTRTRSEIVVPLLRENGDVIAVLDVDCAAVAGFTAIDQIELEGICRDVVRRFPADALFR